jgi:lysophospholipase L1-like esterase
MTQIRIGFVGDSITHGTGDETLLGWPLRAGQAEVARGHDVTVYNLGIRADTSSLIAARWEAECRARYREGISWATVFAVGINDSAYEKSAALDGQRVPLDRSLETIGGMAATARGFGPVLWVGPTPVVEAMMPLDRLPGVTYDFRNDEIGRFNAAYAARAAELGVPYLDLCTPFANDPAWAAALRKSDGLHPNSEGYEMMAARVCDWPGWRDLFDA